jgi:hypothetical protein
VVAATKGRNKCDLPGIFHLGAVNPDQNMVGSGATAPDRKGSGGRRASDADWPQC